MHEVSTSRRAVMRALAILPAAIVTPPAAHAAVELVCAAPSDAAAWDAAMDEFIKADAECRAFEPTVLQAFEAYDAQRPRAEDLRIDRLSFGGKTVEFIAHGMDLDRHWEEFLAGKCKWWWGDKIEARKKAELDSIRAYRKERQRVATATGVDDASRKADDLSEAATDAEDKLMAMPAPHWEAVLWKQDRLFGDLDVEAGNVPSWSNEYVKPFFDDIRRLAGEAA